MKNLTVSKADLISKLKTIEGLTNEERANLIGLLREHKKYGLVWEDKPEDVEERLRDQLPVLCEVKDKAIVSDSPDAPNHILIEGDNLEALTALSYTHEGKIDVIYIDPPYNTGNKDFVYNDSFVDTEDSYRHSKWLSFMNKRLKIAKRLLSDKGVIFISIDDNEQANLKLLCDEVFGYLSYVTTLMIESSVIAGPRRVPAMQGSIVKTAEYCLVYTRNEDTKIMKNLKYDYIDGFDTHYNKFVDEASNSIISLTDLLKREKFITDVFKQYKLNISIQSLGAVLTVNEEVKKWLYNPQISSYLYRQGDKDNGDDYTEKQERNRLFKYKSKWYVKTEQGLYNVFRYIDRIGECDDYFSHFGERTVRGNLWKGFSSDGGNLDKEGGVSFKSGKKPIRLIKQLIHSVSNSKDITVLDFFAGSGTTMHAIMQLNSEDDGKRTCIIVTNNENQICENVTYLRCKNVITGYNNSKGLNINTLRYYKTDYISRDRTQKNMRALVAAATDLLCIKEDLYEEQKKFGRAKVNPRVMRYFSDGRKHMLVVYREEFVDELVEEIKSLTPDPSPKERGVGRLKIYIFSPGRYAFDDSFYEVRDKVQLIALPAAIYDAYVKVLPKRKEQLLNEEKKEEIEIAQDLFEEQEKGGEA